VNWIKVNNDDHSTLPPMGQVVWIIYTSGYDGGPVVQLGGRGECEAIDDDTTGWMWGALDSKGFARSWEPKLYDIEIDDDYNVTYWAALQWPEDA
jgi:hypothetical protein